MKKALIVAGAGGFITHFELSDIDILIDMGYHVICAANFDNPLYEFDIDTLNRRNVTIYNIPMSNSPSDIVSHVRSFFCLKRIIRRENVDIIHCHTQVPSAISRMSAGRTKAGIIYTSHGFHFYGKSSLTIRIIKYIEKKLAKKTDCIITINNDDYNNALKLASGRTIVRKIPGIGIDTERYIPAEASGKSVRASSGIPDGAFYIISAGMLNDNKNHITVIKAIAALDNPNIYYDIFGEGPKRPELEQAIASYGLAGKVRLRGYRSDMYNYFPAADCSVFVSKHEGLGMAALESLSCGIPVIATNLSGTREYIIDGTNGFFIDAWNNVSQLANIIDGCCTDRLILKNMAHNCRKTATMFDISISRTIMKEIYNDIDKRTKHNRYK